ncbi:acyl-CoA dehydrogenase family protein [bacterium]|nr:acyl-CoA dehydrogenase family protein [bacterium]
MATHEVFNQSPPLAPYNLFTSDPVLQELQKKFAAGFSADSLVSFGAKAGTEEVFDWGFKANKFTPEAKLFDRYGNRIDQAEYHPAYHALMNLSVSHGVHAEPWKAPMPGAHAHRAAKYYLIAQVEQGHCCPITMTYAVLPALKANKELAKLWEPKITSTVYDARFLPIDKKNGAILGMAMTEKQGGSDVRANTTKATLVSGTEYRLTGHKWFCSAPMSDAFLMLAQAPGGLTCFLVPRFRPDGSQNSIFIQRLKDKVGNKSNASSEIELEETYGVRVGDEGRGVPTIIQMVNHTRLDCVIGSTAYMRQATVQAIHHARYREAFGKKLIEWPLMQNVLADLSLEVEASAVTMMKLASLYDDNASDADKALRRIATAISKYWVCKRAPNHVYEAMESLGGPGFVEECITGRLYRDAPVNSIWEGSGNVNCLDVFRALSKEPETRDALLTEIKKGLGHNKNFDAFVAKTEKTFAATTAPDATARRLVEMLALAFQGSLLIRYSPDYIVDAFCRSRVGDEGGMVYGTLPEGVELKKIIERAFI